MNRRHATAALAALIAAPRFTLADDTRTRRVAMLSLEPIAATRSRIDPFKRAMAKLGWEEGRTVRYEHRSADGRAERLPALAEALVKEAPDVIVSESSLTTLPLRNASATVAIVAAACDDPLASRFVRALDKPGTNVTGVAIGVRDELPVPVELLSLVMPKGASFAGIFNPANPMYRKARAGLHYGAVKRGIPITYHDAIDAAGIDAAFAAARAEGVAGIAVMFDPLFVAERARWVKLAAAWGKPVIFPERNFVASGGLISYGPSLAGAFARAASHADRILKGAKPADIPVESAGKYQLVVSSKAPAVLRKRADAVL
jgi:putative ABC transport system substrate-binding protein